MTSAHTDTLRNIPPEMDAGTVAEIDARLDEVERAERVRILLAIESGSRAWGFPSPDSDYDCRFVYVRTTEDYLSLFPKRDVIETEMTTVLDVNGWDLAKALKLMLNGNAVIIEWLTSPIFYRGDNTFRREFLDFAGVSASRQRIAQHYIHLGRNVIENKLGDLDDVPLKKVFYALRPAIALRWLRLNESARLAPMNFQELCRGADLPPDLSRLIADLLARKAVTRELGRGPLPAAIREAIYRELETAETTFSERAPRDESDAERADAFFRHWIAGAAQS